ncbi:hypothetical protein [Nocardia alni]|uniref:hypothetical protein n=1 Tax=Nocardia alni TaxID=2815723 RepID=UPI001C248250|nr:hypothetical protein [Nocardia alni]
MITAPPHLRTQFAAVAVRGWGIDAGAAIIGVYSIAAPARIDHDVVIATPMGRARKMILPADRPWPTYLSIIGYTQRAFSGRHPAH